MIKSKLGLIIGAGVGVLVSTWASAQTPVKPDAAAAKSDAPPAKPGVAAYVGGEPITLAELDAKILKSNMKLAQQLYDARKAMIDQIIIERVLGPEAAKKGVTVDQLVKEQAAAKTAPVADADVEAFYNTNKAKMGGKPLEQMSTNIKGYLVAQKENEAKEAVTSEIKAKADVKIVMDVPRVDVAVAANDPVKGPKDAKVTIIEFSEFQ